ncbi:MAG: iron-sulfur cluster assembly scaffold protein [Candidatus Nanohaloarchaea archaeon]|nr:iron-sulfur cluster assembly scaffold protein [Candidatus Nanohaloarchaea archaeon]
MTDLYGKEILDHYRDPSNEGELEGCFTASVENPKCGDSTQVYVNVEDNVIRDFKHITKGCAICTASASMLSEEIVGMNVEEVLDMGEEQMVEVIGFEVPERRLKCAILGLEALKKAINKG